MQENDPASSGISELANFILQSGLFAVEYYRQKVGKLGDGLTDKELVVHYLENGEKLGLRPTELFDIEWYRQENPDVIAYPAGPFAHYVANGEAEGRSPHPLFDVNYYRLTARGPIDRPLYHYIQTKGRAGPNPHPVIDTAKFLEFFAGKINDNTDPLTFIIQNREAEAFFKDLFIGRYYASQLKEAYDAGRHNIVEYFKKAKKEHVSPHPGFDLEAYITHNSDVAKARINGYVHYIYSGLQENRQPELVKDYSRKSITFRPMPGVADPVVGEKFKRSFEGNYTTREITLPNQLGYPRPIHLSSEISTASRIDERRTRTLEDVSSRLRLDWRMAPDIQINDLPLISILLPVYKPPLVFLDRAIRSVLQQSYPNWELCIVDDGSDDDNLTNILSQYAAHHPNIKFRQALKNGGIARATNAALSLADGEFIALFDNDDMLTHDAIEKITHTISQNNRVDLIYSDECVIDHNDRAVRLFSKPDWSPIHLLSCMYTGHFSIYRKAVVEAVGGFRPDYDFSQDYDLALRVSERDISIIHLRSYLYGWRMIEGSAAQGGKPFARLTNVAALQDALERRGYPGLALGLPSSNVVTRNVAVDQPLISIIIPSDSASNILNSITSIVTKTSYPNIQIVVVTNLNDRRAD
ncbi:glycosyltransferase family 2 protein [Methylobacterium oryzae CBMB20]